jgi:hypothetical protein
MCKGDFQCSVHWFWGFPVVCTSGSLVYACVCAVARAEEFGTHCANPANFQCALHVLSNHTRYEDAIRTIISAGGCNCSRAVFVGAVLGALTAGNDVSVPRYVSAHRIGRIVLYAGCSFKLSLAGDCVHSEWIGKTSDGHETVSAVVKLFKPCDTA